MTAFEVRATGDAFVVEIDDELDAMTVGALEGAIADAERRAAADGRVVVSLERCGYCDSSSISALLRAWRRLAGRFFVVVPPLGQCRRIFEITSIAQQAFVVDDMPEALSKISA